MALGVLLAWDVAKETEEADWGEADRGPAVLQLILDDGLDTALLPPPPLFEF